VQIWYRAQPQAKQEAKSASDVIYRKIAPSRDDPKQNSSLLPIVVPSHLTGIFAKGIIAQVIVTDKVSITAGITSGETYRLHLLLEYFRRGGYDGDGVVDHPSRPS